MMTNCASVEKSGVTSAIHYFTIRRGAVNLFTGSKQTFSQGHVALKSKCHLVAKLRNFTYFFFFFLFTLWKFEGKEMLIKKNF